MPQKVYLSESGCEMGLLTQSPITPPATAALLILFPGRHERLIRLLATLGSEPAMLRSRRLMTLFDSAGAELQFR